MEKEWPKPKRLRITNWKYSYYKIIIRFIYLFVRQNDRERRERKEIFHLLVQSQNAYNSWILAMLKSGAQIFWSCVSDKGQVLEPSSADIPDVSVGSWIPSKAAATHAGIAISHATVAGSDVAYCITIWNSIANGGERVVQSKNGAALAAQKKVREIEISPQGDDRDSQLFHVLHRMEMTRIHRPIWWNTVRGELKGTSSDRLCEHLLLIMLRDIPQQIKDGRSLSTFQRKTIFKSK